MPDERVDDEGMAALMPPPGAELGPEEPTAVREAQRGLGTNTTYTRRCGWSVLAAGVRVGLGIAGGAWVLPHVTHTVAVNARAGEVSLG